MIVSEWWCNLTKLESSRKICKKKFVANTELLDGWKVHFRRGLTFTFQRLIEKVQCLFCSGQTLAAGKQTTWKYGSDVFSGSILILRPADSIRNAWNFLKWKPKWPQLNASGLMTKFILWNFITFQWFYLVSEWKLWDSRFNSVAFFAADQMEMPSSCVTISVESFSTF